MSPSSLDLTQARSTLETCLQAAQDGMACIHFVTPTTTHRTEEGRRGALVTTREHAEDLRRALNQARPLVRELVPELEKVVARKEGTEQVRGKPFHFNSTCEAALTLADLVLEDLQHILQFGFRPPGDPYLTDLIPQNEADGSRSWRAGSWRR